MRLAIRYALLLLMMIFSQRLCFNSLRTRQAWSTSRKVAPTLGNVRMLSSEGEAPPAAPKRVAMNPLKVHIFMDGTWLYYSLVLGRAKNLCPMQKKFGENWQKSYRVNWPALSAVITKNLNHQLNIEQYNERTVDVVRTSVFTSMRLDTPLEGLRGVMIEDFYASNFDVHCLTTEGHAEKCVDISLSVEMLSLATVPDAYDIAVIVTGDKDFIPAMQKTRMKGRRVAICSMRNSCNHFLDRSDLQLRDFNNIWIEDNLDDLIIPRDTLASKVDPEVNDQLVALLVDYLKHETRNDEAVSSREVGRLLKDTTFDLPERLWPHFQGKDVARALTIVKSQYFNLRNFLEHNADTFRLYVADPSSYEYMVLLRGSAADVEPEEYEESRDDGGGKVINQSQSVEDEDDEIDENFDGMTVAELKAVLRENGLVTTGLKAVLIERLRKYAIAITTSDKEEQDKGALSTSSSNTSERSRFAPSSAPVHGPVSFVRGSSYTGINREASLRTRPAPGHNSGMAFDYRRAAQLRQAPFASKAQQEWSDRGDEPVLTLEQVQEVAAQCPAPEVHHQSDPDRIDLWTQEVLVSCLNKAPGGSIDSRNVGRLLSQFITSDGTTALQVIKGSDRYIGLKDWAVQNSRRGSLHFVDVDGSQAWHLHLAQPAHHD